MKYERPTPAEIAKRREQQRAENVQREWARLRQLESLVREAFALPPGDPRRPELRRQILRVLKGDVLYVPDRRPNMRPSKTQTRAEGSIATLEEKWGGK